MLRRFAVPVASLVLVACSSAPQKPAPAGPPPPPPAPAACAKGTPREPSDARAKMTSLGDEVRRCFILGAKPGEALQLTAEVTIGEDGKVRSAKIQGAPSGREAARSCAEKALSGASFATFCGDDVAVSWSYTVK